MEPACSSTGTTLQPCFNQALLRSQLVRPLHAVVLVHGARWHSRATAAAAEASWAPDGPEGQMSALARYYALPSLSLRDALWQPLASNNNNNSTISSTTSALREGSSSGGSADRSVQAVLGQAAIHHPPSTIHHPPMDTQHSHREYDLQP